MLIFVNEVRRSDVVLDVMDLFRFAGFIGLD